MVLGIYHAVKRIFFQSSTQSWFISVSSTLFQMIRPNFSFFWNQTILDTLQTKFFFSSFKGVVSQSSKYLAATEKSSALCCTFTQAFISWGVKVNITSFFPNFTQLKHNFISATEKRLFYIEVFCSCWVIGRCALQKKTCTFQDHALFASIIMHEVVSYFIASIFKVHQFHQITE